MSAILYSIKRGSFWQGGKQRHADAEDPDLRTIALTPKERDAMDPDHSHLQSADEASGEAKKLEAESEAAKKKAEELKQAEVKKSNQKGGGK